MNERIRQLAEEAGFMDSWFSESGDDCERELKRFAELLVKECAKAADEGMAQVTMKVEWPSYHIKKHFGVEEK